MHTPYMQITAQVCALGRGQENNLNEVGFVLILLFIKILSLLDQNPKRNFSKWNYQQASPWIVYTPSTENHFWHHRTHSPEANFQKFFPLAKNSRLRRYFLNFSHGKEKTARKNEIFSHGPALPQIHEAYAKKLTHQWAFNCFCVSLLGLPTVLRSRV